MSFRLFIYYCATCGGTAAFAGWVLGRMTAGQETIGDMGVKGMWLGMLVALALGLLDTLWIFSFRQVFQVVPRLLTAVAIGTVGGLLGGVVGQALLLRAESQHLSGTVRNACFIFGWTITGLLVGVSLGVFDVLDRKIRQEETGSAARKILKCLTGGTMGGALGGVLSLLLKGAWSGIFHNKPVGLLWSPSAMGFVALGMCIGLMIGLAQVLFREGWLRVVAGFRPGRELILAKPIITIGRAESCDVGLFGDPDIERLHARVLLQGDRYLLEDAGTDSGTYLNDERISRPTPLCSGDLIRVGNCILRFGERQKHAR